MESGKNGTDEPICKARIEAQMQRTDLWTQEHNNKDKLRWCRLATS